MVIPGLVLTSCPLAQCVVIMGYYSPVVQWIGYDAFRKPTCPYQVSIGHSLRTSNSALHVLRESIGHCFYLQ